MRRARFSLIMAIALFAAACGVEGASPGPLAGPESNGFPKCDDVPSLFAQSDSYRDEPLYVGNEMPIDEVLEWAQSQPHYQEIWIDREHNGWITVAFTQDADQRQQDLLVEFPGVGVVAVEVEASAAELQDLQSMVSNELSEVTDSYSIGTFVSQGVVSVTVGELTPEVEAVLAEFHGEPLCVDAPDPSTLPAPGPQPDGGDGWRLLVDEAPLGEPYRTGIAYDVASLAALWTTIGVDDPLPDVDFINEVVIWFGAVYGSSCPNTRLDDVVVDGSTVHALIVLPDKPIACTADANPHAYVVAVERSKLPAGPFVIQLDAEGPPSGAPEERTVVDADLSLPGAVASPGQIGSDPNLPEPYYVQSGQIIETEFPQPFLFYIHCGIEWLGEFNDLVWRTEAPTPPEWTTSAIDESLEMQITILPGAPPTIEAVANGVTVIYEPSADPFPGCD